MQQWPLVAAKQDCYQTGVSRVTHQRQLEPFNLVHVDSGKPPRQYAVLQARGGALGEDHFHIRLLQRRNGHAQRQEAGCVGDQVQDPLLDPAALDGCQVEERRLGLRGR